MTRSRDQKSSREIERICNQSSLVHCFLFNRRSLPKGFDPDRCLQTWRLQLPVHFCNPSAPQCALYDHLLLSSQPALRPSCAAPSQRLPLSNHEFALALLRPILLLRLHMARSISTHLSTIHGRFSFYIQQILHQFARLSLALSLS